jgi:hypothetical protein
LLVNCFAGDHRGQSHNNMVAGRLQRNDRGPTMDFTGGGGTLQDGQAKIARCRKKTAAKG